MTLIDERDYYEAVDLPIFERELADWLPARIFDVHTHAWLPENLLRPISEERVGLVFEAESVSWAELAEAYALLFPGKQVEWLAFGMPLTVVDREANNAYIAREIDNQRTFGLLIPALDADADTLLRQLHAGRFIGFKPYLSYVTWKPLEEIRILDFVRPAQLEIAHAHALPIMLHVPRNGRLADADNLRDLEHIAAHYPQARIILAHAGRAYARDLMDRALPHLADLPNMLFDLSNVQSAEVVAALLEHLPIERIMYGSDIPVATVRGLMFMLNGQRVCITRKPFAWSISSTQPDQLRCTFMGYEGLRAIKQACMQHGVDAAGVEKLFYSSARQLVVGALNNLHP